MAFLLATRRHFRAPTDRDSVRLGAGTIALGAVVAVAAATVGVQISHHHTTWPRAIAAVSERVVGDSSINIGGRLDPTLTIALAALGIGLALSLGWLLVRPVLSLGERNGEVSLADARVMLEEHGGDTLSYFALRSDKHHVRVGDTLVAYAVRNGVCLVSPDPIGPARDRATAWAGFRDHATRQGWNVAVLGAGESWLPIYQASGMSSRYIGDEAVVDVDTFSLDGGTMKGLRQAVNRIANHGYTIEFHDPCTIDAALAGKLLALMCESRQGQVERGFSMTLSRLFDERDTGLLLAVCLDPAGAPAAFCQYVPATDIDGYSLDLMRRSAADHPNGLTDFVVVRTIEHLRATGRHGLSLNFATMRAVLAGEMGDTVSRRVEKKVMERLSESMQIESLWRYNAKFQPAWRRRYLAYDSPEHLVAVGLAVASAEQFWELPVIGRFLPAPPPTPATLVPA
jgi:lysyl-tRNA synthetase class 2